MNGEKEGENMKVKADCHVHIDKHATKEDFVNLLKNAEKNGVKKLIVLEHNNLTIFTNGVYDQVANNEGIGAYYTGQLIPGVEFDVFLDNAAVIDGADYNGYILHIVFAGFDMKKILNTKWYNPQWVKEQKDKDYDEFIALGKEKFGLEMPPKEYLQNFPDHFVKALYAYMNESEERKQSYAKLLDLSDAELANGSVFIRNLYGGPTSKLFFQSRTIPTFTDLVKLRKEVGGKIIIAHPAHMYSHFDTKKYLAAMQSIPQVYEGEPNFDGIEVPYFLNTPEETEFLENYANEHNLLKSGGSDFVITPNGKMFFDNKEGERVYFDAQIGNAYAAQYYGKDGTIYVDENLYNGLNLK